MAETRKNHLAIDGAQVKDDEHIASYKPIPEAIQELRASKPSLAKSKEKLSSDGAEERLLEKEDQAKITTRVDMADAKYVVGDHRNGDAKIELDANKRQFSGLTKEELMKFADDPFWVRMRWCMFALFWLLWLGMLAGAIAIIVSAPKCAPPPPKTWLDKGPLIESTQSPQQLTSQELLLNNLKTVKAQGLFVSEQDAYRVLEDEQALDDLKGLVAKAKEYGVKVIVDLTASFVSADHSWFQLALNRTGEYTAYFIWAKPAEYQNGEPLPPNNWVSTRNESAWEWSPAVGQFYYQLYGAGRPQLNFTNPAVVRHFDDVLRKYMATGVGGVRLQNARDLLINASLESEVARAGQGIDLNADLKQRAFWQQRHTSDQPALDSLLAHWAHVANSAADSAFGGSFFSFAEDGARPELYLLQRDLGFLRPASAAPLRFDRAAGDVAKDLTNRLRPWPALQLTQEGAPSLELAAFATLLPAAPVLQASLFAAAPSNDSDSPLASFARLIELRSDASIEHGNSSITAVPARNSSTHLLVCARWKAGHTGYAAVWNPSESAERADLSTIPAVPAPVTLHYVSADVRAVTNYTINQNLESEDILVPARSTVVLSYVPASLPKS